MNKFLVLLFSCFLSSCVVYDKSQPFIPPYREHVIIYDLFPQTSPFYNFTNSTYIYKKPHVYGPRNNPNKPRKPRKPRKDIVRKRR